MTFLIFTLINLLNCFLHKKTTLLLSIALLVALSPLLVLVHFFISTFPIITVIWKIFHSYDSISNLFFDGLLYIYITFRFIHNVSIHFCHNCRKVLKSVSRPLFSYNLCLQICLLINVFTRYSLLFKCGDIETNPRPTDTKSLSICHWNLNGISTNCYIKLSMLEAYNALHKYDIICISETFLNFTHMNNDPDLKLQGCELIRSDHPSNSKRGAVV